MIASVARRPAHRYPARAVWQLREGLSLWRGPALADVAELPFAAATTTRLTELRTTATEALLTTELTTRPGDSLLIAELEDLIAATPLREPLRLLHLRGLHDAGRTTAALATFDHYRTLLATEIGTDPGPELLDLHLKLLRGEIPARPNEQRAAEQTLPAPHPQAGHDSHPGARPHPGGDGNPVAAQLDSHAERGRMPPGARRERDSTGGEVGARGRLRAPLTSFVGREMDRGEVAGRLGRARLVTLVGPGGAGRRGWPSRSGASWVGGFRVAWGWRNWPR
ncbi:BTAD domain-containing putative transcriptional regulator [Nocardia seriolae]|uniref:Regulatory protein AfsR n=1 Tax=Nocardia seriolae TaxID=37332 RepID=A0ABC9YPS5_9NOCA|nr:BTAD domain-containing putative transcriptional regulator [Nocardia seriolae]APA96898.1 Regulatory protein AfsR [Nocardia seriolae]OJF81992.1 hypothetical protein NS14008_26010 [Nocardia seriolae]QOW33919.1 hypothetical protein IMZ23_01835 [Nocardia seriolae]QUN18585.1 hypothetical protein KEC46_03895 [Nocardia seriolae]WKY54283.1 BTAD domain-containing putative transcriptional regulator [Nocardia seriolae]